MARKNSKKVANENPSVKNIKCAIDTIRRHPMFTPLATHTRIYIDEEFIYGGLRCPENGWATVSDGGVIFLNSHKHAEVEEWIYIIAHCLLHLGLEHFRKHDKPEEWNIACDYFTAKLLTEFKLGRPKKDMAHTFDLPARTEERLYEMLCEQGIPSHLREFSTAGPENKDMTFTCEQHRWRKINWRDYFGQGLAMAVRSAVNVAAGYESSLGEATDHMTLAKKARSWFINSYPLLGSLASAFSLVEDPQVCMREGVSIAAVDPESKEIFINPSAGLDEKECRFVMAHELLHVGLRHIPRRQGRDPFLWNIACDYVINGWLVEMELGDLPHVGALYDPLLKGESAESIYDKIAVNMRRYRKLCTLAGSGICDILERSNPDWWQSRDGISLDDFYRRCLSQGLVYCSNDRGYIPLGLIEEIRALDQPPIPWDVELAQWFDDHFAPLEKIRSYARPSRRQSSTPDIPRPRYFPPYGAEDTRTFGVVLDTSGSMDRSTLAKALGTIASYSISRDVYRVRVVFCDAAAYDQGYMSPEDIAGRVKVKGRGGTVIQPGIDLLEKVEDFPKDGPILVITDGYCDCLRIRREHAFLIPLGRTLPFIPRGKVFRIR